MIEDAIMAAHPDIPTAQKEIQRIEVCRSGLSVRDMPASLCNGVIARPAS